LSTHYRLQTDLQCGTHLYSARPGSEFTWLVQSALLAFGSLFFFSIWKCAPRPAVRWFCRQWYYYINWNCFCYSFPSKSHFSHFWPSFSFLPVQSTLYNLNSLDQRKVFELSVFLVMELLSNRGEEFELKVVFDL